MGVPTQPAPKAKATGGLWNGMVEHVKARLGPMFQYMLDDASGELEGDTMVVRCGDDLTLESLNCPEVAEAVKAVAGERLNKTVSVRFLLKGKDEPTVREDKLDELIRRGSRFDSFTVKP